jgi:NitT/TauT family transport system ATP-binding protein
MPDTLMPRIHAAAAPPPLVRLRIDRKTFGTPPCPVLRDVAFEIGRREVVALLAPSGTGKSTALRILLGLDTDFAGAVQRGTGRVGVMFQEPLLLPWLTVAENLRVVVARKSAPPDVASLLRAVQIPDAANLYPGQLSLGMARRAALARAMAVTPDLLVLDEPFASLDPQLAASLGAVVRRIAEESDAAIVLATHDLAQALGLATRVLILAGAPATLAADAAVPPDALGRAALHEDLSRRFAFLNAAADARADRLPCASTSPYTGRRED